MLQPLLSLQINEKPPDFVAHWALPDQKNRNPYTSGMHPARLRFVADSGLDDRKILAQMGLVNAEFVIRARHNRKVEVYNDRLRRWEEELLDDLSTTVPLSLKLRTAFGHARRVCVVDRELGWLKVRLPQTEQELWILVAHDRLSDHNLVLITNMPIHTPTDAKTVYTEWRHRP